MFKPQTENAHDNLIYAATAGRRTRPEQQSVERAFARLFSSEDGRQVLAHLQVMTFHRAHSAETSDAQLRYAEGQRALVGQILRLIEKGRR